MASRRAVIAACFFSSISITVPSHGVTLREYLEETETTTDQALFRKHARKMVGLGCLLGVGVAVALAVGNSRNKKASKPRDAEIMYQIAVDENGQPVGVFLDKAVGVALVVGASSSTPSDTETSAQIPVDSNRQPIRDERGLLDMVLIVNPPKKTVPTKARIKNALAPPVQGLKTWWIRKNNNHSTTKNSR